MTASEFQRQADVIGAVLMGEHRIDFVGVSGALDGYYRQLDFKRGVSNG